MLGCLKCKTPIRTEQFNTMEFTSCEECGVLMRADVFEAMFRTAAPVNVGTAPLEEGRAGCFFHPDNPARVPCGACGRFLCELCDVEMEGRHLCFQCLASGEKGGQFLTLEKQRVLYDRIAFSLALYPLFFFLITLVTAPVALFIAIRYFKQCNSVLPRTKIRNIAAIVIASLQIAFWCVAFIAMFS